MNRWIGTTCIGLALVAAGSFREASVAVERSIPPAPLRDSTPLEETVLSIYERECTTVAGRPFDRKAVAASLSRLQAAAERVLGEGREPRDVVSAIGKVLFEEEKFAYDPSGTDPETYLLDRVLERKRGNCLGLTLLYDILGERLGVRLTGGYVPGHMFVRYESDGVRINAETSRKGEDLPDDTYRRIFRLSGERPYLRTLEKGEVVGIVVKTLGATCSCGRKDERALQLYEEAKRLYPELADVYFNTGVSLARIGKSREAAEEYGKSLALDPGLTVARDNLEILSRKGGAACDFRTGGPSPAGAGEPAPDNATR